MFKDAIIAMAQDIKERESKSFCMRLAEYEQHLEREQLKKQEQTQAPQESKNMPKDSENKRFTEQEQHLENKRLLDKRLEWIFI